MMMKAQPMDALVKLIVESGMATPDQIRGCSDAEIKQIESIAGVHLPQAYKNFLLGFGASANDVFYDVLFVYPAIVEHRDIIERIEARTGYKLKSTEFVFLIRDGLIIFFDTADGDDPPILLLEAPEPHPKKISFSFSEWLTVYVTDEAQAAHAKFNS